MADSLRRGLSAAKFLTPLVRDSLFRVWIPQQQAQPNSPDSAQAKTDGKRPVRLFTAGFPNLRQRQANADNDHDHRDHNREATQ